MRDIRLARKAALRIAKLPPGLLPYDLSRSGLRSSCAPASMSPSQWLSADTDEGDLDRYDIVSTHDTAAGIEKTAAFVATLPVDRNVAELQRTQNAHSQA